MRKLLTIALMALSFTSGARTVTPEEATSIASEFLNSTSTQLSSSCQVAVSRAKAKKDNADNSAQPFYIFNGDENKGFVIVSGDDRAQKILGYSASGSFDFENLPPQLSAILDRYTEQLNNLPLSEHVHPSWQNVPANADSREVVLNTATWGQWYPFNIYAPEVDGVMCPSGCVATAMAIVMKYNNWPDKGRGEHKWYSNGTALDFNFGDVEFDYSLMPESYAEGNFSDSEAMAVAKLMQAAAAGVNMAYNPEGSGAMASVVGHYMHEFFRYSPKSQFISAANFDESTWLNMIYEQIDSDHPVIMSGASESMGGHAFVCDGYNSEDYLRINWGWDGVDNGFFSPFVLGGFDFGIGMVTNLFNDGNEKEYARCWNEYGYLWATSGNGAGFNVSVENIEKDMPFNAMVGQITFPNDFSGTVCIALVDGDENIIEVNEEVGHRIEADYAWDNIGYTWVGHGALQFKKVVFTSEITQDMRVQAVAREDGGDWKVILGTIEAPSSIKTFANKTYISRINWNLHDPHNIAEIEYQNDNQESVLFGDSSPYRILVNGGVAYSMVNGVFRNNADDFTDGSFNFDTTKDEYTIDIYANRYENLIERVVKLEEAGTLATKISKEEQPLVYRLTVEGPMNADDYEFITMNLYSLIHLDVSNTTVEESAANRYNFLPMSAGHPKINLSEDRVGASVWGLESIVLPSGLVGFEEFSMPHAGIEMLEIPATVDTYEWNSISEYGGGKLDFVKVNNPVPVDIQEETGALGLVYDGSPRKNTILFVPEGSKEAYAASPSWRGFRDIRECDDEFVGKFVDIEGVRYLILSNYAVISGIYKPHADFFIAPASIDYNGKTYPVKGNTSGLRLEYLYLSNVQNFEFNMPVNSYYTVVTPHLSGCYIDGRNNNLYVPGASGEYYNETSRCNVYEMWSYMIDWSHQLLSIAPMFSCSIKEIRINGHKVDSIDENLYSISGLETMDVEVEFSIFGHDHLMCTTYSDEFNKKLPDTNLVKPISVIELNESRYEMTVNKEFRLEATIFPEDATIKEITWTSSAEDIATVSADGLVKAVSVGSAIITATAADGFGSSCSCQVIVLPVLAESITILPEEWNGVEGDSIQLSAIVIPDNTTKKTVVWSSSDESVAVVDETGLVKLQKEGSCVIVAETTDGSNLRAECVISGLSGINYIFADESEPVDVYSINGALIKNRCNMDEFKKLVTGAYVIRNSRGATTVLLR